MRKNSLAILFLIVGLIAQNAVLAAEISDLKEPKKIFYRMGTADTPEKPSAVTNEIDLTTENIEIKPVVYKREETVSPTYADLSIKSMSMEVSKSVEMDYDAMLEDLSLLWQGAAMKSDTIKFAIYKLSNPDKDKPDDGAVKKVLSTIAGMSTFLGAGSGNPILASAALIGGNTLGIMSSDTKAQNYKYTQVTDADMIILVRKVDELQQKVVDIYYDYLTARQMYYMTSRMAKQCEINYKRAQNSKKEILLVTDTFYRGALDEQVKARGAYFEKRSQLEQLVGNDIFKQFEARLDERESSTNIE